MHDQKEDSLLRRAGEGDEGAREELFRNQRRRLQRMVSVRLDRRILSRLDVSDVVQEVFLEAHRRWDAFLERRPLPFYPWLRQIGWEVLSKLHEKHLCTQKRRVTRERHLLRLPDESAGELVAYLAGTNTSVGSRLVRQEMHQRLRQALEDLPGRDREVLVLRHMEGLTVREIAEVLGIQEGAVKTRHFRALSRLREVLTGPDAEIQP